ncbi:MAG: hypothetical protein K2X57_22215, partial [Xanthobacteraceae bacterium]|nr:hypothetical protein [Xanthobacteraceae bacterium]
VQRRRGRAQTLVVSDTNMRGNVARKRANRKTRRTGEIFTANAPLTNSLQCLAQYRHAVGWRG